MRWKTISRPSTASFCLFDGSASEGAHATTPAGWGDRYRFTTTSAPATYNSSWTWNTPNTIPT